MKQDWKSVFVFTSMGTKASDWSVCFDLSKVNKLFKHECKPEFPSPPLAYSLHVACELKLKHIVPFWNRDILPQKPKTRSWSQFEDIIGWNLL